MKALILAGIACGAVAAAEVAAQHGPDPETLMAMLLATKSACDETIPGYAARYRSQHQSWVARNGDLIRMIGAARYNGMSFGQLTDSVKAEFRQQAPEEQKTRCRQVTALYSVPSAKHVFVIQSRETLAPWRASSFNGIQHDGIDIWFIHATDPDESPAGTRPYPVSVCVGIKSFSTEDALAIQLAETELAMDGRRYRANMRSAGPVYRWLRDSDDAELVGPSSDPVLRKGHYRCHELVFDVETPTANVQLTISVKGVRAGARAIPIPPVTFRVEEQP